MAENSELVTVTVVRGIPFIWNLEDVRCLRQVHRIIGTFVGLLPHSPLQNCQLGLPLKLMNEEANLLYSKGLAKFVEFLDPTQEMKEAFNERRRHLVKEQSELYRRDRIGVIKSMADKIVRGKKQRLHKKGGNDLPVEDCEREKVVEEEIAKIKPVSPEDCCIQTATGCPFGRTKEVKWDDSQMQRQCSLVFNNLWENGYYLTSGQKFGGNYLAYFGDPVSFHASFIVSCQSEWEARELFAHVRMATQVKKTLLLAQPDSTGQINYLSLRWPGNC